MANWWDDAPLAQQTKPAAAQASGGGNWWDEAPKVEGGPEYVGTPGAGYNGSTAIRPVKPDRGVVDAGLRGALQGASLNFSDEMAGLRGASGLSDEVKAAVPFSGEVVGGIKKMFGNEEAQQLYEQAVARERDANKTTSEQHPVVNTVGEIAGSLPLPLGAAAQGATLPARMGAGAIAGGVLGGISGAGGGETPTGRAIGAGIGAGVGGALGAAIPGATDLAIAGAQKVAQPFVTAYKGFRNPDDLAAGRVAKGIERDIKIDPSAENRLTPQEFSAGYQNGDPVSLMDLGGETTRGLARSAANTSPEGRAALDGTINKRFEGQTPRVVGWLNKNFNYPDASATQSALDSIKSTVNRPAYEKAYSKGQSLWDDGLDQLSQAPVMQQAIRMAFVTGRNRDTLQGFSPIKNPFVMNKETGVLELQPGATPNLQFWDHVKRNLDGLGAEGQAFSKALRGHLDQLVPDYQKARAGAAAFFGAENALEAGQKIVTSTMNNGEIAKGLAAMTPLERKLAQDGFISQFNAMLREVGDRRTILNKISDSPAARERMDMVIGPQKAREFEAMLRVEGIMDKARGAIQGNSSTARQLTELGLAGGTYGLGTGGDVNPAHFSPSSALGAALVWGAARGRNHINEKVSQRVAEMLASKDPAIMLRGISVLSNNKQMFESLRKFDKWAVRAGSEQGGSMPALQSVGQGRADEQQPNVGGPGAY